MSDVRIPARKWHPATCFHKWCNCYDPASHERDGDCRHCRRRKRNAQALAELDDRVEGLAPGKSRRCPVCGGVLDAQHSMHSRYADGGS